MKIATAYDRVTHQGFILNRRTLAMLKWAEKDAGIPIRLGQGSYSSTVSVSGGTHDGGGAIDVDVSGLKDYQRKRVVISLKRAGFAAWFREACSLWAAHIHAIAIGDKQMSPSAARQVVSFKAGRDGLTGNRPDPTYRTKATFNYLLRRPI